MNPQSDKSGTVVNSDIYGEDADDAAAFSTVGDYNGRSITAAVVADGIAAWTQDVEVNSPSIITPLTTIKDRPGWSENNAMVFLWEDGDSDNEANRQADSYDSSPSIAPILHIEFTPSATTFRPRAMVY